MSFRASVKKMMLMLSPKGWEVTDQMVDWGIIVSDRLNVMGRRQSLERAMFVLETEESLVWLGIGVWGVGTAWYEGLEIGKEYDINFMCLGEPLNAF